MKKYPAFLGAIAALALAVSLAVIAPAANVYAQPSGAVQSIQPLTRNTAALITNTARVAGTATSADQDGYNVSRVVCSYNQTTSVGSPSVTFSIQGKHPGASAYYNLVTSAAMTSVTTYPVAISAGAGVATTANAGAGIPVAKAWRVSTTVTGTTSVTGTIACSIQ